MGFSFEKKVKDFKRAIARNGMYASAWLFDRLPYIVVRGLMHVFIFIGFRFTIKQKAIARETLSIAFGDEKSPREIDQIIKRCFENLGQAMIELVYFLGHPGEVDQRISFEGKEYLDAALEKKCGVIAVTAHFGNFPLMMLSFARQGYPVNSIIRPARDRNLEEYLYNKRKEVGVKTIYAMPRHQCVTDSLKVLRNNEILFVPIDQNFGRQGGVFVDFFGQKAATAPGPIVFSLRTKAVILPMFIIREKDDQHKVIIEPPLVVEEKDTEEETIRFNISKITSLIEQYIRRYPHEWGWMHRRWKSQPDKKKMSIQK